MVLTRYPIHHPSITPPPFGRRVRELDPSQVAVTEAISRVTRSIEAFQ